MTIDMARRLAIEVVTGTVPRHRYVSVPVMEPDAGGGDPRREARGASRQALQ